MGVIFFSAEVSEKTTICNNRDRTHNSVINKKPEFEDLKTEAEDHTNTLRFDLNFRYV